MLDFLRLASRYHIPTLTSGHSHCRAGWAQCQCPFCGSKGSHEGWYLGFSLEQGNFHCWRCGSVRFWDVLDALLGSHTTALAAVQEFQKDQQRTPRVVRTRQKVLAPPPGAGPLLPVHKKYLASRNFDPATLAAQWDLLGTSRLSGIWSWRVIIPIRNETGRVVAYQGRAVGDAQPKYRMTEDARILEDPHGLLYGIDKVPGDTVLVVEGCPGVWRIGPGAVATFGIDWKKEQMNRLRRFKRRFILFDPEPKAQERAEQLASVLGLFPGTTEVLSGFKTDPGDFSERRVARLRESIGL